MARVVGIFLLESLTVSGVRLKHFSARVFEFFGKADNEVSTAGADKADNEVSAAGAGRPITMVTVCEIE